MKISKDFYVIVSRQKKFAIHPCVFPKKYINEGVSDYEKRWVGRFFGSTFATQPLVEPALSGEIGELSEVRFVETSEDPSHQERSSRLREMAQASSESLDRQIREVLSESSRTSMVFGDGAYGSGNPPPSGQPLTEADLDTMLGDLSEVEEHE